MVYIQSCLQTIYRVTHDTTPYWTSTLEACPCFSFFYFFWVTAAAKRSHGPRLKQEEKKYRHQASCSQTVYIQSCLQTIYRVTHDTTPCWTSTLEACPCFRFLTSFSSLSCCKVLSWATAKTREKEVSASSFLFTDGVYTKLFTDNLSGYLWYHFLLDQHTGSVSMIPFSFVFFVALLLQSSLMSQGWKQDKNKYQHPSSCSQTVYTQSCSQTMYRVTHDTTPCWTSTLEACPYFRLIFVFSATLLLQSPFAHRDWPTKETTLQNWVSYSQGWTQFVIHTVGSSNDPRRHSG